MRFEWDDGKNAINLRKHGIDFGTATAVFDDPLGVTYPDGVINGELRWSTIGNLAGRYVLIVAHTLEEDDEEVVRLISAREATRHERRRYEGGL